jgi:tetratricopeptide repeat protein 21B
MYVIYIKMIYFYLNSLGKSLCKTHNYEKALNYYENALRQNKKRIDLLLDLAKLCIQIKHYSRAEELLQPELFAGDSVSQSSLETLKRNVEGFVQIAILHQKKMG